MIGMLHRQRNAGQGPGIAGSLGWIDEFFREARHHIFARDEDCVIILPPNQVYKANSTGISIVRHMLAGGKVSGLPGITQEERARQVAEFVSTLRSLYLGEAEGGPASRGSCSRGSAPGDRPLQLPVHPAAHPGGDRGHLALQQRVPVLLCRVWIRGAPADAAIGVGKRRRGDEPGRGERNHQDLPR